MTIARHRGTVWAVREALRAAGYADAELQEGLPVLRHDGSQLHNGVDDYTAGNRWALFKVIADIGEDKGVGGAELQRLLRLIERSKNVRSVLREVAYRATVADDLDTQDTHDVNVTHVVDEVRPAGPRHDGTLTHSNATKLPRQASAHDGSYRHTGELRHDGLLPYFEWNITGTRYDNRWDLFDFALTLTLADTHAVRPLHNRRAAHDGSLTHGGIQPPAMDQAGLTVTLRRRYNARLLHNGAQTHSGDAPINYAM